MTELKRISTLFSDPGGYADETLPCAKCKTPVLVSGATIGFAASMNRIRSQRGIPLVRKSDGISLCPKCYEQHRESLQTRSQIHQEHDDALWREWLAKRSLDDRLFESLISNCKDKSGIRQLGEQCRTKWRDAENKTGKKTASKRADGAVFGGRE